MLKAIGTLQLAIAPLFVIPAVTAQEGGEGAPINGQSLSAQLDSTLASIEYLAGLRSAALAGDDSAVRAIVNATEPARDATPQRNAALTSLQDNLARLRFQLDRLLSDPAEVAVVTAMPPSVVKALGLGSSRTSSSEEPAGVLAGRSGADAPLHASGVNADGTAAEGGQPSGMTVATDPLVSGATSPFPNPLAARPDTLPGTSSILGATTGLDATMRAAIAGDVGPLDFVSDASRRRGGESVSLEEKGYVADPIHLGKLLVRAGRPAEAVEILKKHQTGPGARYWLARALQGLDRETEAIALFRLIADDGTAGIFSRHAAQDLKFLEFKSALQNK